MKQHSAELRFYQKRFDDNEKKIEELQSLLYGISSPSFEPRYGKGDGDKTTDLIHKISVLQKDQKRLALMINEKTSEIEKYIEKLNNSEVEKLILQKHYLGNMSIRNIAKELNVTNKKVRYWISKDLIIQQS